MPHVDAQDLKNGDIVLVEVFVSRWIPKEDTSDGATQSSSGSGSASAKGKNTSRGRWYKKEWKKWNIQFNLDAISLLFAGSEYYVEESKKDEEVEM